MINHDWNRNRKKNKKKKLKKTADGAKLESHGYKPRN